MCLVKSIAESVSSPSATASPTAAVAGDRVSALLIGVTMIDKWRGAPRCENPWHQGLIGSRCADCGKLNVSWEWLASQVFEIDPARLERVKVS